MRDTLAMLRVGGVRLKRCAQARLDLLGALLLISSVRLGRCAYANLDLFGDQVLEEGIAPWEILGPNPWPNTIAICAIMRDENPEDIRQWLRYHKCVRIVSHLSAMIPPRTRCHRVCWQALWTSCVMLGDDPCSGRRRTQSAAGHQWHRSAPV